MIETPEDRTRFSRFSLNPKKLALIDAVGALLTFLCLLAMLTTFQPIFGIPSSALKLLIIAAFLLCTFSTYCFFFVKSKWQLYLGIISLANVIYCFLTAGLVIYHFQELTTLGIIYFLAEILIIGVLARIERYASDQIINQNQELSDE